MIRKIVLLAFVSVLFSAMLVMSLVAPGTVRVPANYSGMQEEFDAGGSEGTYDGQQGLSGLEADAGSATSWPMFHHDLRHTGYSTSKAPKRGDVIWNYRTGYEVWSSPAVADGMVFVGSSDNKIYALNETTGVPVWSYTAGFWFGSSPAVADGMVFIGSCDNRVYALNETTGDLIWNYTTGDKVWSSPTVADGMVFIGSDDKKVYALNETIGDLIWNYTTGDKVWSCPAVADSMVFVGSHDGKVYAFNETTGAPVWNYTTGFRVESSPAVSDGMVFVGSYDNRVYALNDTTGDLIWNYTTGFWVESSPAVADGLVFVGSRDGKVYALNETTGVRLWSYTTGRGVGSSPAVADGLVFVGSDNRVYALNETTGALVWSYKTGGFVESSPAVAGGMVFIGSNDYKVYCFGVHDVAVTSVAPSVSEVYAGQVVNITVIVRNEGTPFNETFDVSAYYDSVLIETLTVTDLAEDTETTLTFSWNTTGVVGSYYTISANTSMILGEIDTADNIFIDGTVKVTSPVIIAEVIPCNQTGYPKNTFQLGTMAFFKVTISSTALIPQDTLITINLYDNASVTIGVASFQGPILPVGTSAIIFGLPIPTTATIGTAKVYASSYTDWPHLGGFPHCPEASASLEITGP